VGRWAQRVCGVVTVGWRRVVVAVADLDPVDGGGTCDVCFEVVGGVDFQRLYSHVRRRRRRGRRRMKRMFGGVSWIWILGRESSQSKS